MMATRMARHRLRTEVQGGGAEWLDWLARHARQPPAFNRRTSWGTEHRPDLLRRGRAWLNGTYHVSASGSVLLGRTNHSSRGEESKQGSKFNVELDPHFNFQQPRCHPPIRSSLINGQQRQPSTPFNNNSPPSPTVIEVFAAAAASWMVSLVLISLTLSVGCHRQQGLDSSHQALRRQGDTSRRTSS